MDEPSDVSDDDDTFDTTSVFVDSDHDDDDENDEEEVDGGVGDTKCDTTTTKDYDPTEVMSIYEVLNSSPPPPRHRTTPRGTTPRQKERKRNNEEISLIDALGSSPPRPRPRPTPTPTPTPIPMGRTRRRGVTMAAGDGSGTTTTTPRSTASPFGYMSVGPMGLPSLATAASGPLPLRSSPSWATSQGSLSLTSSNSRTPSLARKSSMTMSLSFRSLRRNVSGLSIGGGGGGGGGSQGSFKEE